MEFSSNLSICGTVTKYIYILEKSISNISKICLLQESMKAVIKANESQGRQGV